MKKAKVCILTAGVGNRLGDYAKIVNKALLPLEGKAVISHIIEYFPADTEFVIAVGYKADQVRTYLELAHPERLFTYVEIENYNRAGSGPGHSLNCCKAELSGEFFLVCADTLWTDDVTRFSCDASWIGVAPVDAESSVHYCNVLSAGEQATGIQDKVKSQGPESMAFVGLAFIKDPDVFWRGLAKTEIINGEKQLSSGFKELIRERLLQTRRISWTDVGTEEKYVGLLKKRESFDFSKAHENIYTVNGRVIKFYDNPMISENRYEKSRLNQIVFPVVLSCKGSFYTYKFQKGETLYIHSEVPLFRALLDWLEQNLWIKKSLEPLEMRQLCDQFYRTKTYDRVELYNQKYSGQINISIINGKPVPTLDELLHDLNWEALNAGKAFFVHGDLQPDNILFDPEENKFLLIDWRQDFAGRLDLGDIYYDFAKLWGGLNMSYEQIKRNNFHYTEIENACEFEFPSHAHAGETKAILEAFLTERGYSITRMKILVALIYLNMSPLRQFPFDKMLHALARQLLFESKNLT